MEHFFGVKPWDLREDRYTWDEIEQRIEWIQDYYKARTQRGVNHGQAAPA